MRFPLLAAALLASMACAAHADTMYNVNGTFASGGSLTGYFTLNAAGTTVTTFDLKASASGSYTGFEYTTADAVVTASTLPQYFQIDSTGNIDELRLYFSSFTNGVGGTLNPTFSYEHEPSGGNRFPSGTVTAATAVAATPEPTSFALLGTGLLGLAGGLRKRFA